MSTIPEAVAIVQRCEALFEDLDLGVVKAWKAAVPGRKAIGYMPVYVPRELVHAAGMLPVGILGGGDALAAQIRTDVAQARDYFASTSGA
jgi:benzoyl-CoA reductase subunit C